MVSLQPNRMNEATQTMDDVTSDSNSVHINDVEPILSSTDNQNFEKLGTIPFAVIHIILTTALCLVGVALGIWKTDKANNIITLLSVGFWQITFNFDLSLQEKHNILRIKGYHKFSRSINRYNGQAFIIVSGINSVLLLNYGVKTSNEVQILITVICLIIESILLYTINGLYISKIRKFNGDQRYPDALEGANNSAGSLGLMQPDGTMQELHAKQLDLIIYLTEHNVKLRQRLIERREG